jgi:hypothetical protein
MEYKEAQAVAKAALRTSQVVWDGRTLNLGKGGAGSGGGTL